MPLYSELTADSTAYALKDRKKEQQWSIRLPEVLARSAANQASLLAGHTFYISKNVQPSRDTLKRIVEAAGGSAAPANTQLPLRPFVQDAEHHHLLTCAADAQQFERVCEQYAAKKGNGTEPLAMWTPELILTSVLRQELDWSPAHRLE